MTTTTPPISATELLRPSEVARRWSVSTKTVYRLADEGQLHGTRIGKRWRFDLNEVVAYERREAAMRTAS